MGAVFGLSYPWGAMARPFLDSLVPVPLVAIVLLMLVALVFLKVRAARAARSDRERGGRAVPPRRAPATLPADPAEALAAMKAGGAPHG